MDKETITKMLNAERKFVESVKKNYGSSENMFIQIYHHALFDDELTIKEIFDLVGTEIIDKYPYSNHTMCYDKDSGYIMVVGNLIPSSKSFLDK